MNWIDITKWRDYISDLIYCKAEYVSSNGLRGRPHFVTSEAKMPNIMSYIKTYVFMGCNVKKNSFKRIGLYLTSVWPLNSLNTALKMDFGVFKEYVSWMRITKKRDFMNALIYCKAEHISFNSLRGRPHFVTSEAKLLNFMSYIKTYVLWTELTSQSGEII